jgi:hypothetical protein
LHSCHRVDGALGSDHDDGVDGAEMAESGGSGTLSVGSKHIGEAKG